MNLYLAHFYTGLAFLQYLFLSSTFVYLEIKAFKRFNQSATIPTVISVILVLTNVHINKQTDKLLNQSNIFKIGFYQDFNGINITFKKNNTYIKEDICLGVSRAFGNYTITCDTFKLDDYSIYYPCDNNMYCSNRYQTYNVLENHSISTK